MNRCPGTPHRRPRLLTGTVLCATALLGTLLANAQVVTRQFPPNALRGDLVVTTAPEVQINGQAARLSPGARIHNSTNNALVLSASLSGQKWRVNYVCDMQGLVHQVWLLTEQEAREPRPGQRRFLGFNVGGNDGPVCGAKQ